MDPIVYYILGFAVLGAIGMAWANRSAGPAVRKQRWLKYFMYILITGTVIASISLNYFLWTACIITVFSLVELLKASRRLLILPVAIFLIVASGFLLYASVYPPFFLLSVYFQVLIFDGFSQVAGQLWGKTPLWPSVSPTKTVEGLAGGWICCTIAAALAAAKEELSILDLVATALVYGFLTALFSFCGDMAASYYKRRVKIKDYSNWLPGQGGFLDRFDSLIFTGFFYYILYMLIFRS